MCTFIHVVLSLATQNYMKSWLVLLKLANSSFLPDNSVSEY